MLGVVIEKPKEDVVEELKNICPNKKCGMEIPISDWLTKPVVICPKCGSFINRLENIQAREDLYAPIPELKLKWIRAQDHIAFVRKAKSWLALGIKDSGKGSLLENVAIHYPKVIDCYGAADMESLCWCKPYFERVWRSIHGEAPRILLVSGNDKEIASKFETCHISELTLRKIEEYEIITTCHQFFSTEEAYFAAMAQIVKILYSRTHWIEPWYVLVREASNWIYARQKVVSNDKFAKAEFVKAFRESRHHGLAMAVDTLRWTSLDKEIRDLADYTLIKRVGSTGLPDDLKWIYGIFNAWSMMWMKVNHACIKTLNGAVGVMRFGYPLWHKEEHDDMLKICEIEIKDCDSPLPDDRNYRSGQFEHAEIIRTYVDLRSMTKTAETLARSYKMVRSHLKDHNASIRLHGKCLKCYNSKGEFVESFIHIRRVGRPKKGMEPKKIVKSVKVHHSQPKVEKQAPSIQPERTPTEIVVERKPRKKRTSGRRFH